MRIRPSRRRRLPQSAELLRRQVATLPSLWTPLRARDGPCGSQVDRGRRQSVATHCGRVCELALGTMSVCHAGILREPAYLARLPGFLSPGREHVGCNTGARGSRVARRVARPDIDVEYGLE